MATKLPTSMRALALPCYCKPEDYDTARMPLPEVTKPDDILINCHAASINPIDVKLASGQAKIIQSDTCVVPDYSPPPTPYILINS